jgi:hypothetical protein
MRTFYGVQGVEIIQETDISNNGINGGQTKVLGEVKGLQDNFGLSTRLLIIPV